MPVAVAVTASALMTAPAATAAPASPDSGARAVQAAPCPALPCEGSDPGSVSAWHTGGAPKVLKEAVLASGSRLRLYTAKPAWDPSGTIYSWAEVTLTGTSQGRGWLRTEENLGDGITIKSALEHPRSYRDTSGTTGMFLYDTTRFGVVYANGACVTDGKETGCVNATASSVAPNGPCAGWCSDADLPGADSRAQRPVPVPGARLTATGSTKMIALDPLSGKEIAGLVVDGKEWAFATRHDDNLYLTDKEGTMGPCAPGETCEGVAPSAVTQWASVATDWSTAALPGGQRVTLSGSRPSWSVSDHYAWAHTTATGTTVWLEDRAPGGTYTKVAAEKVMKATSGQSVRACISDGTSTACTKPLL